MIAVIGRVVAVLPASPSTASPDGPRRPDAVGLAGQAARIALAAAAGGARVELVAKLGDDRLGDATLFALTRAAVGHAAMLRDASRPTPTTRTSEVAGAGPAAGADDEWAAALDEEEPATGGRVARGSSATAAVEADDAGLALAVGDLELALRYLVDLSVLVLADPAAADLVLTAADGAAFHGAALVVIGDPAALPSEGVPEDATILAAPATDPEGRFASLVAEYAIALDGDRTPAEAWAVATRRVGAERA